MAEKIKPKAVSKDEEAIQQDKLVKLKRLKALESQLAAVTEPGTNSEEQIKSSDESDVESEMTPEQQQIETAENQMSSIDAQMDAVEKEITAQMKLVSAKSNVNDAQIEQDLLKLENEVAAEAATEEVKSTYEKLVDLHPWLEQPQYGFMYGLPPDAKKKKKDYESWQEEWSHVILDYARVALMHVVYPKNLLTEKPFSNFQDRTKSVDSLTNALIEKKIAEWLDKKKEILRVYWKSLEEWATLIIDWAHETGKSEPIILAEIRESTQEFSNLPDEDLKKIFKIIEKRNAGKIIPIENGELSIKINLD